MSIFSKWQYPRLDIHMVAGFLGSLPIDISKQQLPREQYMADPYIQSLDQGVFVMMGSNGFVVPWTDTNGSLSTQPLGVIITPAYGFSNQNLVSEQAGLISVAVGSGNQWVTDNVVDDDIVAGQFLYIQTGTGILTNKKPSTNPTIGGVALSSNSASNKAVMVQQMV